VAGNHTLGTIRGTIAIDYDGAGIVKATKDSEKSKGALEKMGNASDKVLGQFKKFSQGALLVSKYVGTAYNAITAVSASLAVLAPLAGAAFAAAPALILGFASALIITKVALSGVSDAMAAAAEGGKKFDDAMKKLSPQAQAFVREYKKAIPVLNSVKKSLQDAFFKGTTDSVTQVVEGVEQLAPAATRVSGSIGAIAKGIVAAVTSGRSLVNIETILNGVNAFLVRIKASFGPVIQAFISIGAQAATLGGTLGGTLANALAVLARWLNSIDVAKVFATAAPILATVGQLLSDVGSILGEVFGLFNVDGANAIGVLSSMVSSLASFLATAEGQSALTALGQAIQAIGGAAGQVFLAFLQAVAPVLVALAPGIATLAGQIAGVLVPALAAVSPILSAVAGFLSDNMTWVGPLAGGIVALAAAYKTYSAVASGVETVQKLLASSAAKSTIAWISNTAAVVANKVAQLASAAVTGGAALAGWVANTAAIVANRVATVASTIAGAAARVATIAWTAVQWLLNVALSANPIGLVVLAIAALVAGIIYAWKNSETFRNVVLAVWGAIKVAIAAVVNWITGTVWPSLQQAWNQLKTALSALGAFFKAVWKGIKDTISVYLMAAKAVISAVWSAIVAVVRTYINIVKAVVTTVFSAIRAVVQAYMNAVRAVVSTVWNAIVAVVRRAVSVVKSVITGISVVVTIIRNAFNRAKAAVSSAISGVVSLVRSLPGKVSGALGNLGSLLYSKGASLVRGFINGIASMIGAVRDKAASVVSAVTDFLPGSPAKEGPLSGKGYALLRARRMMADFAQGMQDNAGLPVQAVRGAVVPVSRAMSPRASTTRSGPFQDAPPIQTSAGAGRVYNISVGDKVFAKLVVDAITGEPVAVSKAANEGSRKSAWAGSGR
jgi:hypothetical protein